MEFLEKLQHIQEELKAPKNLYNSFGKYKYRNAEGICEAVKPLLAEFKMVLTLSDEIVQVGERYYIKATVTILDVESEKNIAVSAFARESLDKKGMDDSQITGTASSYARKYALNGLFLLDDTKDADSDEYHNQTSKPDKVDKKPATEQKQQIETISDDMYTELQALCKQADRTEEYIAKSMGVSDLKALPASKFAIAKVGLQKIINAPKEEAGNVKK